MIRGRSSPRERVQVENPSPELGAKQSFKKECDINVLMSKYLKGGVITHLNPREARFLDVSEVGDLRDVYDRLEEARSAFEDLPSEVRDEFDHDPLAFVEFATDEDNRDQLEAWGLTAPAPESEAGSAPQEPVAEGDEPPPEEA